MAKKHAYIFKHQFAYDVIDMCKRDSTLYIEKRRVIAVGGANKLWEDYDTKGKLKYTLSSGPIDVKSLMNSRTIKLYDHYVLSEDGEGLFQALTATDLL